MDKNIQLVVFDWAGTTTDFGSQAPVLAFDCTFSQLGLHFGREEINAPMGMEKKAHIQAMLSTESGTKLWTAVHGTMWIETDVERLYQSFEKTLAQVVAEHSHVIAGVPETVNQLRAQGIKIGSTTGYTAEIMQLVLPVANVEGYAPDNVITPDVPGIGRPAPFMLYECMRQANVYPASRVVKVGDTVLDILEGKNAGAWTIGILIGSNLMGLSQQEFEQVSNVKIEALKESARISYQSAGADLVIDSILDLPAAIDTINARIVKREADSK